MTVRLDSCTECWLLLMMSSTGNDVWGAAQLFTVCVSGRESVCTFAHCLEVGIATENSPT